MRLSLMVLFMTCLAACGHDGASQYSMSDSPVNTNDGQSTPFRAGFHSLKGWENNVVFYVDEKAPDSVEIASLSAAATWNAAIGGKKLVYAGRSSQGRGDSLYSSLEDSVSLIYFEKNWDETTGKNPVILATTIWENSLDDAQVIVKGDIILNAQEYVFLDAMNVSPEQLDNMDDLVVADAETVILHEMGHFLGLTHVNDDSASVMNTYTVIGEGESRRQLSPSDINHIQTVYDK